MGFRPYNSQLLPPKLSLERRIVYTHQRSGWGFALASLSPLFLDEPDGTLFDSMIETNFARDLEAALREGRIPYRRPWIGFCHVPPEVPPSFDQNKCPLRIFELPAWRESLLHCQGLLALSQAHAAFLRSRFPSIPVAALRHPTERAARQFSFDSYLRAGQPLVQVGWWLRRLASIHHLSLPKSRKFFLLPHVPERMARFRHAIEAERAASGAPPLEFWNAAVLARLPNPEYDELLSRSVVFLHLHAASANNAIIECMVRRTPVLVSPLPSVREYLGEGYPLYFTTLDEAAAKASDQSQVLAAHQYLAAMDMEPLSGDTFCRDLARSALYQSLPIPRLVNSSAAMAR